MSGRCSAREFTLDFPPETASLHITADTRYTLFVNGVRLGSGPMKYFQAHIPYDTYDIAPCLRCGKNVIGVLVHYWGVGTMQHQFGEPGLWLQAIVQGGGAPPGNRHRPGIPHRPLRGAGQPFPPHLRAAGFY